MSKMWTFIGGVVAGIVGVFTTAGVALELDARKNGDNTLEEQEKLPLTAGEEG